MHWKTVQGVANLVATGVMFRAHTRSMSKVRPATVLSDGRIEFPPNRSAYWGWLLVILPPALATVGALHRGVHGRFELWFSALIGMMALTNLFSFPGTIVVGWEGLEQVYWLRPEKRIRWSEIVEIRTHKGGGNITIESADGTKIVHSHFLADRPRLLEEIKGHCGSNLPLDFPRVPLIELRRPG